MTERLSGAGGAHRCGTGELDLSKNAQAEAPLAGYVFYHAAQILGL